MTQLTYQYREVVQTVGVFAIAIATSLAFRNDPANITFQQDTMRDHLLKCLESGRLTVFQTAIHS